MRRTSLLVGALLLGNRFLPAQTPSPFPHPPAMTAPQTNPNLPTLAQAQAAPPEVAVTEDLTTFDPVRLEVIWQDRAWKLVANGVVVKDFGRRESDARLAARLVHDLHLSQHGTVGGPTPVMEYWLNDGHAPTGIASGMRTLVIDTDGLKVEQNHGQWVVRDRQRVWMNFGVRGDQAQQALAVMRKHHFTQVATVGAPAPTMMVFLGTPVHAGSGAARFQPPKAPPSDAAAIALAGYAPPTLPPLQHAAAQPNQPTTAFNQAPTDKLPADRTTFLRGAPDAAPGLTERVTFDWRQAQVRHEQGHWKLAVGSHVLYDFGANQQGATEALKAVQFYRFTEQCRVGEPGAEHSYFLVAGQAPHGMPFGVHGVPFDTKHLDVQRVGDRYAVTTLGQPLMTFGQRPDEARHMLDVIRRHHFDYVCHVGGPEDQAMTFLVKGQ